jgi:cobalt-precorrin-7 (C5)-methyltransferase
MKIVGVGAGPNLLTQEAIAAIESAEIIFGSKRAIELAKEHIRCKVHELKDYSLSSLPGNAVVLSTGDPMLSGLGKFGGKNDTIIPGISSLQLACCRLNLDMENISVLSAHSRDIEDVKKKIRMELDNDKNIFLLPDPTFGVDEIAGFIRSMGLHRNITVCEQLGYPDEKIWIGDSDAPPVAESEFYVVVIHTC